MSQPWETEYIVKKTKTKKRPSKVRTAAKHAAVVGFMCALIYSQFLVNSFCKRPKNSI